MTLYFCKPPNVVMSVHSDDQIWIDPVSRYGNLAYVIADYNGPAASMAFTDGPTNPIDGSTMQVPNGWIYPTITAQMQADSVKLECRRRITTKVSDQSQRNITTRVTDLQTKVINGVTLTPAEQTDVDTAAAIWTWIGATMRDPTSMLGTSDALVAANDPQWYEDVKWPSWNSSWDAFVARF